MASKGGEDGVDTVVLHEYHLLSVRKLMQDQFPTLLANIIQESSKVFKQQDIICIQGYFGTISEVDFSKIVNIDQEKKVTKNEPCGTPKRNRNRQRRSPLTTTDWEQ